MLKIENVSKKIRKKEILNEVNLTITKGEAIGIVGANGSGKSTLIDLIVKDQVPTTGSVIYEEEVFFGVQYQDSKWPIGIRVKDVIKIFKSKKILNNDEDKELLKFFEIDEFFDSNINKLSGGQRQRFNCYLALANDANFLIFDELITGLDLKTQVKLMNYICDLKEKNDKNILIISHIPEEIEMLTDKFILINEGKIINVYNTKDVAQKSGGVRKLLMDFYDEIEEKNNAANTTL